MIQDIRQGTEDTSFPTRVRQWISNSIGSESKYWERDLELARQGAGFLAVYCPASDQAQRILRLLKPEDPKAMRRYASLAIEVLA